MYTCTHCKNKFKNNPFIGSNNKKYCSRKYIPNSKTDEPYSFEYFNLIESINNIESKIPNIKDIDDRFDLENEVNDLNTSYIIDMLGDDDGFFYKRQIYIQLKTLNKLYNKIHNIFMERKVQLRYAVIIYWNDLLMTIDKELYNMILKCFQEKMKNVSYENLHYSCINSPNTNEVGCSIDKLYVKKLKQAKYIKKTYYESLNQFKSEITPKQLNSLSNSDDFIIITNLAYCVVCDESLNIYRCGIWTDCNKYEDYYSTEY